MKVLVNIRFTDSGAGSTRLEDLVLPLTIDFNKDDINKLVNTSWLKMMIRSKLKSTERRRLRLIYNGRVLNDQTNFKHDVFEPKLKQLGELGEPIEGLTIYVHCLVGDELTAAQLEQERELDRKAQEVSTAPQVIGFDRLLLQGVSPLDVNDLRRQFHQIYLPDALQNAPAGAVPDVEEDESRQAYIRQLEERWLESTVEGNQQGHAAAPPNEETGVALPQNNAAARNPAAGDLEGTDQNQDLLLGFVIGAFLGVVSVVFLMMDDSMFNKTQKMAVIPGVMINIMIAFLRVGWIYT